MQKPKPKSKPKSSTLHRVLMRAAAGFAFLSVATVGLVLLTNAAIEEDPAALRDPDTTARQRSIGEVKSWGYQLQRGNIAELKASPHDLLVIDPTLLTATRDSARRAMLDQLKHKPDGSGRLVVAYLSIGEAETYRSYWRKDWVAPVAQTAAIEPPRAAPTKVAPPPPALPARTATGVTFAPLLQPAVGAPAWLGEENAEWRGNFRVRYWDADWQALLFGTATSLLDRLIADGFDGVYIDRADVHTLFRSERPGATADMIRLVSNLATYARRQSPNFLVILQNAEELLAHTQVRQAIDAVAKEDLIYGINGGGVRNDQTDITASLHYLRRAKRDGRPILVVEYLDRPEQATDARREVAKLGFIPYIAPRALDRLNAAN